MNALTEPNYLINAQGERIAVMLPIEDYEELLEDLADAAAIAESYQVTEFIPHEQVIAELKADGLL